MRARRHLLASLLLAAALTAAGLVPASAASAVSAIAFERDGLLYDGEAGEQDPNGIWAVPAAGGEQTRLVRRSAGEFLNYPDFAPDGSRLAFNRSGSIVVSDVDGGNQTPVPGVVTSYKADLGPLNQIVFSVATANAPGPYPQPDAIRVIDAGGGGLRTVYTATGGHSVGPPAISAVGDRIVFQQGNFQFFTPEEGLWRVGAHGENPQQLTADSYEFGPTYSPDGTRIAFARAEPGTTLADIFLMNAGGGAPTNVTNTPNVDEHSTAFSPDGGRLAMTVGEGLGQDNHIETIGVDGTNRVDLTGADPGREENPTWANVAALPAPPDEATNGAACGEANDKLKKAKKKLSRAKKKLKKLRAKEAPKQKLKKAKKKVKKAKKKVKKARAQITEDCA